MTELEGTEENARRILKNLDDIAQERVIDLLKASGLVGSDLAELVKAIVSFWKDKERRNRYIGASMTRGLPRRRAATIKFDAPSPEQVWTLAKRFRENGNLFSIAAHKLRSKRSDDQA